jgi:hypothetical protein
MKTLLERAKPELKKAIASFKVDYPNTATRLEETLKQNCILSEIPYGVIIDLGSVCRSANIKFDMNFPWGQFEDIQ